MKSIINIILYVIALIMGIASIIFSYTGLPWTYDTEPLLGIGILCIALAGLNAISKNK